MMINKNRFRVSNDKKVLHKIGKRWVTVSALTLALLGGGALAGSVTTHAASNQPQAAQTTKQPSATPKGIMKTASALHANVLANAQKPASSASAKSNVASQSASSASSKASSSNDNMNTFTLGTPAQQKRSWNFVQNGVRNNDFDNTKPSSTSSSSSATQSASSSISASSVAPNNSVSASAKPSFNSAYQSYMAQMSGTDSEVASANADNVQSDKKNVKKPLLKDNAQPDYFSGKVTKTGNDLGLNYKVYANGGIEFTDGTAKSDLSDFSENYSDISNAKAIKFDNNIDISKVSNMNQMFNADSFLQSLTLPSSFDTGKVTNMDQMFSGDSSLQSLTLPSSFDTRNVTNMHYMFQGDTALQSLTLPNSFDTSKVTDMDAMFNGDSSLQSLILPSSFDTSNVTDTGGMFNGDSSLQSLTLPNSFDTSKVTYMTGMFGNDRSLQSLTLSSSFNTSKASDAYMFESDGRLQLLTISSPNTKFDSSVSDTLPQYKKNNSDNYTSTTKTNLEDGKSHVGTWLSKPNPKPTVSDLDNKISSLANKEASDAKTIASDNSKISSDTNEINDLKDDGSITLAFSVGDQVVSGNQGKYITLDDADVRSQPKYNNSSDTYDITNLLKSDIPTGYHINGSVYAKVQPLNDGFAQILLQPGQLHASGFGATRRPLIKLGGVHFGTEQAQPQDHIIPIIGNSVTYKGTVTLNYYANGTLIKTLHVPYSNDSGEVGNKITILNGNDYINKTIQGFNTSNYKPSGSNNYQTFTVDPSAAPNGSNTITTTGYSLNFNAQDVNDTIKYDLSGSNIPKDYQGQTGTLKTIAPQGTFDTGMASDTVNNSVPANYHIVSGNNGIQYDGNTHTVEVAPNMENVSIKYNDTDNGGIITGADNSKISNHGKTYTDNIQVPYDTKVSDVTKNVDIPSGYSYVNGNKSYVANGNATQSDSIGIKGNQESNKVTVIIHKTDRSKTVGSPSDKSVTVSGATGTQYSIDPSDSSYNPKGYAAQGSTQTGTFEPNNQLSQPTMNFTYDAQQGAAITVNYVDQDGNKQTETISKLNTDDTGNISDKAPTPAGYTVNNGQPTTYHVLPSSQTITIHTTGELASTVDNNHGKATIYINKTVGGKSISDSPVTVDLSNYRVGDSYTINPGTYKPNGYDNGNQDINGTVNANGLSTDSNSKQQMTFTYSANTGASITVNYINQNGARVGSGQISDQLVDSTGVASQKVPVPSGYKLNSNQPSDSYRIGTTPFTITLKVTGKPADAKVSFVNQHNNPAGTETIGNKNKVGDTVSPTQYPTGYELPANTKAPQYQLNTPGDNNYSGTVLQGKPASDMNGSKATNYQPSSDSSKVADNTKNGYATITVVERAVSTDGNDAHGKVVRQYNVPINENNKRVGDSYIIKSTDSNVNPKGYDADNSTASLTGTINTDGSLSNPTATFYYTVNSSNIEPINITFENQNHTYINYATGEPDTKTNATYQITSAQLATLGNAGDTVDITPFVNAPKGYHFGVNKDAITDVDGQHINSITLDSSNPSKPGGVSLVFALWTPEPKKPVKPASNANKSAGSAGVKPSSSASAKPSSTSVAPSSSASVAPSSASVAPSSASSVAPSSQSVAPSSAAQSTSTSYVEPSASGNTPQPVSASTSATPVQPSHVITPVTPVKPLTPAVHKHTTTPSEPNKVTKPSDKIVNKSAGGDAKAENKPVAEVSHRTAKVQHDAASHMANVGNMMAQPTVHAADIHASHVNAGSVQHQSTQHKLPQTNEAKAAGLMGASAIMAALGLAGADTDRKRRRE